LDPCGAIRTRRGRDFELRGAAGWRCGPGWGGRLEGGWCEPPKAHQTVDPVPRLLQTAGTRDEQAPRRVRAACTQQPLDPGELMRIVLAHVDRIATSCAQRRERAPPRAIEEK